MATFDDATFRTQFPAFADTVLYAPSLLVVFWDVATGYVSADDCPLASNITGNVRQYAVGCMMAHLLTLRAQSTGADGQPAGGNPAFVQSATVDKVSVQRMAPPAEDMWTWWLSSTPYGAMLAALFSANAVGGCYVGGRDELGSIRRAGGYF